MIYMYQPPFEQSDWSEYYNHGRRLQHLCTLPTSLNVTMHVCRVYEVRPLQINFLFPVLETTNVVCGRAVNSIIYIAARPTGNT